MTESDDIVESVNRYLAEARDNHVGVQDDLEFPEAAPVIVEETPVVAEEDHRDADQVDQLVEDELLVGDGILAELADTAGATQVQNRQGQGDEHSEIQHRIDPTVPAPKQADIQEDGDGWC